jgi:signal transduction histidine kinase
MNNKMSAKGGSALGGKNQIENTIVKKLEFISKVCALFVFLIGSLATLGWQFDFALFKRIHPSLPVIAPNTAVSFVIISILILISSLKNQRNKLRYLILFASLVISVLGVLTLFEYIFGISIGIDRLFFARKMGETIVRMSPQSALNFFAIGITFFCFNSHFRKSREIGQWVLVGAGIIAFASLSGFIYNIADLYTISPFKGMAAHTAVAFLFAFTGMILLHSDIGFMKIFTRRGLASIAARRLFSALVIVFILEVLVMIGRRTGIYNETYESLIHLVIVTGIFIFLIFFSFRSLDKLAEAEQTVEHFKEIDRAKTEFVSLASHQLRTPLTSISWFSEMLLNKEVGPLNPKQTEYTMEIFAGNRRMIDLVDDLLNASKIDMGVLTIEPKMIDLKEIAKSVLEELAPAITEKNMQVEEYYDPNLSKVELDPELTRIIFQNLISNSVKYSPEEGKIIVKIDRNGPFVNIEIADNGYGIQKNQQSKIFTKLFRADNIRSKVTDGTGLGLYIVKAIVEQSGGKIRFVSPTLPPISPKRGEMKIVEAERGTTFYITLPIKSKKIPVSGTI